MRLHQPKPATTSGISWDAEYRRTIGALFAVYWLVRIGIDGERGFSFGVDDEWRPREVPVLDGGKADATKAYGSLAADAAHPEAPEDKAEAARRAEAAKRLAFYEAQDWGRLQRLLVESGVLRRDADGDALHVNEERAMALLSLTAFHDIMKVEALLPQVQPEHAPYATFKEGDMINDHDVRPPWLDLSASRVLRSAAAYAFPAPQPEIARLSPRPIPPLPAPQPEVAVAR